MFFVRGHAKRVLKCVQCKHLQNFPNPLLRVTSLLWSSDNMEGLEGLEGLEQKRVLEATAERMKEDQQEQQEKLSELIDKVNDQAGLVGEIQQGNLMYPKESVPRISLLQGHSVGSTGSIPRIPSSLHTPTGVYGAANPHQQQHFPRKNMKNPDLPTFSGEIPTPKGRWSMIILFFNYRC